MPRKEFTQEVANRVLIRCRRHCCVCGKSCGTNIELHHIVSNEDNTEDNALPVCFDCHAKISHYNPEHPRGRKYQPSELKTLREITFQRFTSDFEIPPLKQNTSAYGKGFHEGATLTEKLFESQLVWNFVARHGDFAIEILLMFGDSDSCSMMDETLYDNAVDTGADVSQGEGHKRAWDIGLELGLWFLNPDKEMLILTKRGKFFRDTVRRTSDLQLRLERLKKFWDENMWGKPRAKPGARPADMNIAPGWLGLLQVERYGPVKLHGQTELFVLASVDPDEVELKSVESARRNIFPYKNLESLDYEEDTGLMILKISETGQEGG